MSKNVTNLSVLLLPTGFVKNRMQAKKPEEKQEQSMLHKLYRMICVLFFDFSFLCFLYHKFAEFY